MTDKVDILALGRVAVQKWGRDAQAMVAIEEMAELTQQLCHLRRGRIDPSAPSLLEEIADVYIALASVCAMVDDDVFQGVLVTRAERLARKLVEAKP